MAVLEDTTKVGSMTALQALTAGLSNFLTFFRNPAAGSTTTRNRAIAGNELALLLASANRMSTTFNSTALTTYPGLGKLALNSSTQGSTTQLVLSPIDLFSRDWTNTILNASVLFIVNPADPSKWLFLRAASVVHVTSGGSFYRYTGTVIDISGSNPFANNDFLVIGFEYGNSTNLQNSQRLLGRATAGAGVAEELTVSQALDLVSAQDGLSLIRGASVWTAVDAERKDAPTFAPVSGTPLSHTSLTLVQRRIHTAIGRALDEDWLIYDQRFLGESTPGQYSSATNFVYLDFRFFTPCFGMLASLKSFGSATDVFCLSLIMNTGNGDGLYATYNRNTGQVLWGKSVSGAITNYDAQAWVPSSTFDFAFTVAGTSAVIWVRDTSTSPPGPWLAKSKVDFVASTPWDFRHPATLGSAIPTHNYFPGSGSITITRLAAGWPAPLGYANATWITHADGRPYLSADMSKAYFAATLPYASADAYGGGVAYAAIAAAESGIFEFNLADFSIKLTARLCVMRGGDYRTDYTGSIVYDDDAAMWRIAMPAASDLDTTASTIRLYSYQGDILHGFHQLGAASSLNLSTSATVYDPDLRKISGTWYLAYTEVNGTTSWSAFYPNLATSPDLATWTPLGPRTGDGDHEGSRLIRLGGTWKVVFSQFPGSNNIRFYPLAFNTSGTTIANPLVTPGVATPSHYAVAPLPINGATRAVMLSFDAYAGLAGKDFTWGRLYVFVSVETEMGYEFEPTAPAHPPRSRRGAF